MLAWGALPVPASHSSPMTLLALDPASALIGLHRREHEHDAPASPSIPRRVMQYWDRNPPVQIQTLIDRTRSVCTDLGVEHVLFDDARARAFLVERFDADIVRAYDTAVHPAMKCDVFRLAYLHASGGHYIDADIVLRPKPGRMFELPGQLLVYQWDSKGLSNLCNWLIGASAGDPTLAYALRSTAHNVVTCCERDPQAALKNILGVSGPGIFTRGVATHLEVRRKVDDGHAGQVRVEAVSTAHQFIQLGPAYLKAALDYKDKGDARHWLAAGSGPASGTSEPAAGWWTRMRQRFGGSRKA